MAPDVQGGRHDYEGQMTDSKRADELEDTQPLPGPELEFEGWELRCSTCGGRLEAYRGQDGRPFGSTGITTWCPACQAAPFGILMRPPATQDQGQIADIGSSGGKP
jgi:hypothetical protein